ncbi:TPA: UDP-N-acetylmuramoyl-tripeptide--D-alanyl-D-alanine ligase, partial [Candidatus Acetothermia bacterium]|nr:UDP-N-acetylmuramoyl-tripeptide--D-alanyl-D-alanine ligase [Candidatus Acetothermia bacterium]
MFSTAKIAKLVGGKLLRGTGETPRRVIHDSRLVQEGDLFIAFKGERTDGHAFLEEAFARGACGAIVSAPTAIPKSGRNVIWVEESLRALWTLAAAWRKHLQATFIGVTGTCGKTTTKMLLAHLLAGELEVFAAPESYNTEIGVPLALLAMSPSAQVGVFELGASKPEEIAPLAALLVPQVAILTLVGRGHLAGFENLEAVAKEKWTLIRLLPPDGTAIVNIDCPELARLARGWKGDLLSFGLKRGKLRGTITEASLGIRVEVEKPPLRLASSLLGRHNATNLLAAAACALHLDISPGAIERQVATFKPISHRLTPLPASFGHLIDDTYNANPDSMEAALRTLAELELPVSRRSFVFGDMLELGEAAARFHREILRLALGLGISPIFPVGE